MAMSPVKKRKAPKGTRNGGLWFKFIYSGGGGGGGGFLSRCHQGRAWKMPGEEGESLVDKCILGSQCKGPGAEARVACLATRRSWYGWSRVSHGEGNRM